MAPSGMIHNYFLLFSLLPHHLIKGQILQLDDNFFALQVISILIDLQNRIHTS